MGCFFKEVLPEQLSLRVGPWWILDLKGTSFCNEPRWYMCIIFCVVNTSVDQVKEGFACLSSLTASKGLALFRIRPKLHMAGHIVFFDVDPLAIFFGEWWFFVWPGNMFQHIILYISFGQTRLCMQHELTTKGITLNPCVWMCWGDEDFIGRISRTSRHQHARTCPKRTIQVSLMTYRRQWKSFPWEPGWKEKKDVDLVAEVQHIVCVCGFMHTISGCGHGVEKWYMQERLKGSFDTLER